MTSTTALIHFVKPTFPDEKDNGEGRPPRVLNTRENLQAMLKANGLTLVTNAMNLELEIYKGRTRLSFSDDEVRSELVSMASRSGLPVAAIDNHLSAAGKKKFVHPVRRWLEAGEWDGVERVNDVIDCLNATDKETALIVMRKWLVGAVASLYETVFSSKCVPVLQGDQSYMKTAYIARLGAVVDGAFLEGAELNPDNKDSVLSVIRSWIVELGELERTSKNCQGSLKAFITKSIDTVRPPYARFDIKKPRQTNMIATVNGCEFLRDETGSTRYAVIELDNEVDIERLNTLLGWQYKKGSLVLIEPENLRQFWLEVKSMYTDGEGWNLELDQVKRITQVNEKFRTKPAYEEVIMDTNADADESTHKQAWMTATQVCYWLGFTVNHRAHVGRTLNNLSEKGHIQAGKKNGCSRYKMWVPHGYRV
ncbi:hypothetical protein EZV61_03450 [Corallincola luteus]|uniref:Virulence-associated protein E-like domain-containing protein n=2 Tax=Corallincola luteus TaxID=1775177 RepID=A0ABY2ASR5_9GAMM|nr:hypothetical protein EZV61_03450 [Corallincola luteus]